MKVQTCTHALHCEVCQKYHAALLVQRVERAPKATYSYASYQQAIDWIAGNDEPGCLDAMEMKDLISVVMTADIFRVSAEKVADDVIKARVYNRTYLCEEK